ncbi:shikimate dehydrogenase [Legionella oakridgensis]|uniref:Shikimate dehydrogenase (NADP(+)) n=2 Tax=Legionella oakridgensis TaxID=29423 RepID=W0BHY1_9GAMM|nr:shikimate dehydrogenase [Legionella oakridgensis]AHE68281.1 shikimate 5-dehydrogenase [Legionella oakridgensis ATCC 33761 = DSM 21215]ETO92245.1 shikimate 5-dehydrogenase [Legionella oakridgensis RV-2-2007]KTD39531.1 shikimate 5-dehydrogenase [Legionella oakridgensis]STY21233.1 shikimate 5-dehydrogenase [Legionella longbeachae]
MLARYAVMGNPIHHSLSPIIHETFAKQTNRALVYERILIDESKFEQQVQDFFRMGGKGLNITLPCKQRAFAMSAEFTQRCFEAGAANTLWMQHGKLYADNTDGVGLLRDLAHSIDIRGHSVLVIGAGGAARGILAPLLSMQPARLTVVNRTLEKAMALQKQFMHVDCCGFSELTESYDVIINATSSSLQCRDLPIPPVVMKKQPFCYDLAYRLKEATPFVAWARQKGCRATDGLGMLVEQAAEAFFIWHGVMPEALSVLNDLRTSGEKRLDCRF